MSAFLFGSCGCCSRMLAGNDRQAVVARMPWPLNFTDNGTLEVFSPGFLEIYYNVLDASGNKIGRVSQTQNIYGKLSAPIPPPTPPDTYDGPYFDQPYTFAQQNAAALTLLGLVDLLNPDRSYPVAVSAGNVQQVHLCYAADAAAILVKYPNDYTTQSLYIDVDQDGNVSYSLGGGNPIFASVYNAYCIHAGTGGGGDAHDDFISVSKQAVFMVQPLLSQSGENFFLNVDPCYEPRITVPVNMPPGEYIFDPGDVGGNGMVYYSTAPAPGLPPP